ncbi:MAG TPA: HAMP domain-containing sensor histidine kinase [Aestuariivirga sp.]
MVKKLVLRAARYKLGLVIFCLLVPIAYFGSVLTLNSLNDLNLAKSNMAAVDLVDMTFRTMVDLASGWSESDQQNVLLTNGPKLAETAAVTPEFEALRDAMTKTPSDRSETLTRAHALIIALGDGPLVNAAGNREANAMARAGGTLLPAILVNYREMQVLADASMWYSVEASKNVEALGTLSAALSQHTREFKSRIGSAQVAAGKLADYDYLQASSDRLVAGADIFESLAFDPQLDPLSKMQKTGTALRAANKTWLPDVLSTWVELHKRLSSISVARMANLRWSISQTIGFSLVSAIFSLGMAIRMFNSTAARLDDVEIARKEAEVARYAAESGTTAMEKLNNDLAAINKEASQHLKALENAQEQLVKKGRMEQMGQLTATMAHELRNPLGAARTSIFLLERKTRDKGLGVEGQIQRITNAIMRCDDIIAQLLDFSRTKQLSPTSGDFDAWLERTLTEEALRLPQAVSISCKLGTQGRLIAFDPSRMQRALTNLLGNASEAMVGNGEGSAKFNTTDPHIEISSAIVGDMLQLSVSDNGPGISTENLARVREPLFTTKSFGTGLGLPAVEQIAAQHGGTMKITSKLGRGTTATILLPLVTAAEAA